MKLQHTNPLIHIARLISALTLLTCVALQAQDIRGMVSKREISIRETPNNFSDGSYFTRYAVGAALPDGGTVLAWNSGSRLHVRQIDSENRTVTSFYLDNLFLADLRIFEGSTLHILAFVNRDGDLSYRSDKELFYIRTDLTGKILLKRSIVGGQGIGPLKIWHCYSPTGSRIEYNGKNYAIFTTISRNFAATTGERENIHEGDLYVVLDKQGNVLADLTQEWSASHSNMLKLAKTGDGRFFTMTSADGFPFGLYMIDRARYWKGGTRVVWPDFASEDELKRMSETNYLTVGAGYLDAFFPIESNAFIMLSRTSTQLPLQTRQNPNQLPTNVLVAKLGKDLSTLKKVWLTSGAADTKTAFAHSLPGNKVLVAWSKTTYDASEPTMAILDPGLNIVSGPTPVRTALIDGYSVPFSYPNGDVAWVTCPEGGSTLILNRFSTAGKASAPGKDLLRGIQAKDTTKALDALSRGADPNASERNWSALLLAVYYDNLDVVQALVNKGASTTFEVDGYNALALADAYQRAKIAEFLRAQGAVASRSIRGTKPRP
ncbi:MAG: ankyrin repeat domain-containing protein [Leptospirales bacterium]|nr:ankyrin repeat domain-containing protein [Leptospirales bacterium]